MALQKLCLAKIVDTIDRFCHAYSMKDRDDLQKEFLFLQRGYSSELLSRLFYKGLLREEHADLVFNNSLRTLRTKWLSTFSVEIIVEIFARIGPNLDTVYFNERRRDVPWEDLIRFLSNVQEMVFGEFCNDDTLWLIAEHCPRLETLTLKFSEVSDDGLKAFLPARKNGLKCTDVSQAQTEQFTCHSLRDIDLDSCSHITHKGVELLLKNLPLLEKVCHYSVPLVLYKIHKDSSKSLDTTEKYNLKYLDLRCYEDYGSEHFFGDLLRVCFTVCPYLKYIVCAFQKSEHLNLCSMVNDLEDLTIDSFESKGLNVSDFLKEKGGQLISLTLGFCTVSVSALEQCLHLTRLSLISVLLQYDANDSDITFGNLKEFTVNSIIQDNCEAVCRILRSSPALESMHFVRCRFLPPEAEAEILKCCENWSLKCIEFYFTEVGLVFIKSVLVACSSLESLKWKQRTLDAETKNYLNEFAKSRPNKPIVITKL